MSFKFPKWLIAEYLEQLNRDLFDNRMDISDLKVKQNLKNPRIFAYEWNFTIQLNPGKIGHCDELFNTLAHELIHYYQESLEIPNNHGGAFFRFYAKKYCGLFDENYKSFKGY